MLKKSTIVLVVLAVLAPSAALAKGTRRPANDEAGAASVIEALPFSETVSLVGATLEPEEARPSCSAIRSSVWYALSLQEEGTVIGEISSTFPFAVAVYEPTSDGILQERACASERASTAFEFEGARGTPYLVQLSATGKMQGLADVSLRMSSWREVSLFDQTFERRVEEQHVPIVRLSGRPRESDPSMYDVTVEAWQTERKTVGLLTFGLVKEKFDADLVRIPPSATAVRLNVSGRYDSSQYRCAADDGAGTCYAGTPFRDVNWLGNGDAARAEIVVTLSVHKDGAVILERSQSIPYAGQVLDMLP